MSKRLMPTYLVNFLKEIYDGTIPSNFGKRMVSRQFIARVKELYETLGGTNPSDYSRRMVSEYLIKFFNEIEIVEYTDDDVLITKTIPSDLVYPACRVDAIGGASYKCNNLFDKDSYNYSNAYYNSVGNLSSATDNSMHDEAITVSPNTQYTFSVNTAQAFLGVAFFNGNTFISKLQVVNATSITFTTPNNCDKVYFNTNYNSQAIDADYLSTIDPMLNIGGTALPYQPYFTGIRDSAVTAVKTYNIGDELLDTYTVPSAITSLEGYGQSDPDDPTVYNLVDFVTGKYYEKGYIDNGTWVSKVAEISITEQAPLLECVDGGTIAFENTYNQDMFNEVTTWIKGN